MARPRAFDEDILASIKRVIAEEGAPVGDRSFDAMEDEPLGEDSVESQDDVLELDEPLAPPADLGPPLVTRQLPSKVAKSSRAAERRRHGPAAPQFNPLEEMVREMLRPILKQWLDDHLPEIVEEHVKREISRITGRPLKLEGRKPANVADCFAFSQ